MPEHLSDEDIEFAEADAEMERLLFKNLSLEDKLNNLDQRMISAVQSILTNRLDANNRLWDIEHGTSALSRVEEKVDRLGRWIDDIESESVLDEATGVTTPIILMGPE